jgi:hypothetical protein
MTRASAKAPKLPVLRDLFGFSREDGERHELHGDHRSLPALGAALRTHEEARYRLHRAPYGTQDLPRPCRTLVIRRTGEALTVRRESPEDAIVIEAPADQLAELASYLERFGATRDFELRVSESLLIGTVL